MSSALGRVLLLYALLICFGDAFKLHTWVPIPLAVLLLGVVLAVWSTVLVRRIRVDRRFFRAYDVLLLAFLVVLGVSLLFSGSIEPKNLNHLIAYSSVVVLYYFFVKFLFAAEDGYDRHEPRIRSAVALSVLLVSAYAVLEFIDRNLTHLGVTSLVWFPESMATAQYQPLFLVFVRARGFMGESAMLALFLNTFVPMSLMHVRRSHGVAPAAAFLVIAIAAAVVTFSVGALAFMALGLLLALGMYTYDRGLAFVSVRWAAAVVVVVGLVGIGAAQIPREVWDQVLNKLSLVHDPASGYDRMRHWSEALPAVARHPFLGTGIGSTSAASGGGGVISFYLTMMKEGGIFALLLILAFFALVFREIATLPRRDPYKYAYAASFVAALCHYAIISDIWYPWFWLLCVFIMARHHSAPAAAQDAAQVPGDALARAP